MRTKTALPQKGAVTIVLRNECFSVESHPGRVVIKSARDNVSPRPKSFFIRYLAAEGYIPAAYQGFAESDLNQSSCLTWMVDQPGLRAGQSPKKALRQILRLVGCMALVWLVLMIFAFVHAPR